MVIGLFELLELLGLLGLFELLDIIGFIECSKTRVYDKIAPAILSSESRNGGGWPPFS
jgi:hypothetical protein